MQCLWAGDGSQPRIWDAYWECYQASWDFDLADSANDKPLRMMLGVSCCGDGKEGKGRQKSRKPLDQSRELHRGRNNGTMSTPSHFKRGKGYPSTQSRGVTGATIRRYEICSQ